MQFGRPIAADQDCISASARDSSEPDRTLVAPVPAGVFDPRQQQAVILVDATSSFTDERQFKLGQE
jgi:hypothetical protein